MGSTLSGMQLADGDFSAFTRYVQRISIFLLTLAIPAMTGCTGFFIPVCQANNDCPTSSTGTGTSSGTSSSARSTRAVLGGGRATTFGQTFLYVSDARAESIRGYAIAADRIQPTPDPLYTAGKTTVAIAIDPQANRLFRLTTDGGVYVARIGQRGGLQPANSGRRVAEIPDAEAVATDRTGKYLFVAAVHPSLLLVLKTDAARGKLTKSDRIPSTVDAGSPRQIFVDPKNQWVIVLLGKGGFDFYRFNDRTGTLGVARRVSPLQPGVSEDIAAVVDTSSRFLYVSETGTGIRVFRIGADGLTEASALPQRLFSGSSVQAPSSLAAAGHMLFAAYPSRKFVAEYIVDASGRLTLAGSIRFPVASSVRSLAADSTGSYLLGLSDMGNESLISSYDVRSGKWLRLP